MELVMKKSEIVKLYNVLKGIKDKHNKHFSYNVAVNKTKIEPIAESIVQSIQPAEGYVAFEKGRNEIIMKYSNGKNVLQPSDENYTVCREELIDLADKHKEDIDEYNKQIPISEELLESTETINVSPLKFEHIPEEIEQSVMDTLLKLIDSEEAVEA